MAGYHNSLKFDLSSRESDAYVSQQQNDYVMNLAAAYRVGKPRPMPLSVGSQPDFWGPLRGNKVTQDSFLSGRGQPLSKGPECDVRWMPESIFPMSSGESTDQCQRTDLEPMQTRLPKSCNGLSSTDTTAYWMMPSAWQKGYTGFRAVVDTNMQTRQPPPIGARDGGESYGACAKNYGSYSSGGDFSRYAGGQAEQYV